MGKESAKLSSTISSVGFCEGGSAKGAGNEFRITFPDEHRWPPMRFAFADRHAEVKPTAEDGQPDEYFREIPRFPCADHELIDSG